MRQHKFKVGDIVTVAPSAPMYIRRGSYEVVRQLWSEAEGAHYRLKSLRDGHERTLPEKDLVAVLR
jgi:hypothetical protein